MQFKKTLVRLLVFIIPSISQAQTTFLAQGDKQNILLERLEIKAGTDSILNFSKTRPLGRYRYILPGVRTYQSQGKPLTRVDEYNIRSLYQNDLDYLSEEERALYLSKKPVFKKFYTSPANMLEVHVTDFDLVINPVIQYTVSGERNNDQHLFLNTRGFTLRGNISRKIGFFAYVTDNQERPPLYVQQFVTDRSAAPGAGFYKPFKAAGGLDYFDARGYITFNAAKYIDVTFGYDKNFIGNGQRSLFLSDFGANNLFLKLNTRIWKFNYQNLFMELQNAHVPGGDRLIGKKYAAMHHLDVNIAKWLNVGVFEGIVFGRPNRFDFAYLNPVIFYRSIESQNGSFDNSVAGLDAKVNIAKKIQLYGQFLLDEFSLEMMRGGSGWWANKTGLQLGAKYIDAFGIPNLDLQLEGNSVRPFTYSHRDSVANYTHYNQPLAHPLMAGFREIIGVARYQPAPKWTIQAKAIYYQQGRDSSAASFGSNIFLPSVPPYRTEEYGYSIGAGWKTNTMYASLLVSYELRENMFLELFGLYRSQRGVTSPVYTLNTTVASIGFRWNMHRREFEF